MNVTVADLVNWSRCPFSYWCRKQPELRPAGRGGTGYGPAGWGSTGGGRPQVTFGGIVHATLKAFFARPGPYRTPQALLQAYEEAWSQATGRPECGTPSQTGTETGFADEEERQHWYREGTRLLLAYASRRGLAEVRVRYRDVFMQVAVGGHVVGGRLDRVDELEEGILRLVDYRTGRFLPHLVAHGELDLTAAVYALLALKQWGASQVEVVYDYLRPDEQWVAVFTRGQLPELERQVESVVSGLGRERTFLPAENELCPVCDYRALCPVSPLDQLLSHPAGAAVGEVPMALEKLVESHPLPPLLARLGQVYLFNDQYELALGVATRAVDEAREYPVARRQAAAALMALGRPQEAVEHLRAAWQATAPAHLPPAAAQPSPTQPPPAQSCLAQSRLELGMALAEALLAVAQSLDPTDPAACACVDEGRAVLHEALAGLPPELLPEPPADGLRAGDGVAWEYLAPALESRVRDLLLRLAFLPPGLSAIGQEMP